MRSFVTFLALLSISSTVVAAGLSDGNYSITCPGGQMKLVNEDRSFIYVQGVIWIFNLKLLKRDGLYTMSGRLNLNQPSDFVIHSYLTEGSQPVKFYLKDQNNKDQFIANRFGLIEFQINEAANAIRMKAWLRDYFPRVYNVGGVPDVQGKRFPHFEETCQLKKLN